MLDTFMSDQVPLQFLPLQPHEFNNLPAGFEYEHEISDSEASNTITFDVEVDARDLGRCVVCGRRAAGGPRPGVARVHVIGKTEDMLWALLKKKKIVPSSAKSMEHEPRNGISLCDNHHSDFAGYRFFIRWVPSVRIFVFVNFSRNESLEQFHGKSVVIDADHLHSPFPAPFLIQEMRTRGFHPWRADRPIPYPRSTTYALDKNSGGGVTSVTDLGGGSDTGVGLDGSGGMGRPGGSGGAASSSSEPPSTGINQQYLVLGNPFQDPELLKSMRREWQKLPNWKSATVEGLTWEGTAEENARKYIDLVGDSTTH